MLLRVYDEGICIKECKAGDIHRKCVNEGSEKTPSRVQRDSQAAGRHDSAHLMTIHEPSAPACPYAMTQRDNCGSRLLQPLVSVTKIGTQVSCHSKSLFFRSLSIKQSGPHAKMPRGEERGPSQSGGGCFWKGSRSGRAPGRIKKKSVYRGGGGKKYVGGLGAEEDCGKAKGES